jgi:RHS repeat-associated protein
MFNGHGDVVQTVSEKGKIENEYEYDVWGNVTFEQEAYACNIRYSGYFWDQENSIYYCKARYYNPYLARFETEDSYTGEDDSPLSLNLYTYTHNDPVNFIDPDGHSEVYFMGNKVGASNVNLINGMAFADLSALWSSFNNITKDKDESKLGWEKGVASIEFSNSKWNPFDNDTYKFNIDSILKKGNVGIQEDIRFTYRTDDNGNKKTQVRVTDLMGVRGYSTEWKDGNIYVHEKGNDLFNSPIKMPDTTVPTLNLPADNRKVQDKPVDNTPKLEVKKVEEVKNQSVTVDNKQTDAQGTGNGGTNKSGNFKQKFGDTIDTLSNELGIEPDVLGGILLVESGGTGFSNGKMIIRFEAHRFNALTKKKYDSSFTYDHPNVWELI